MLNGNRVIAIRARARRGWSINKIARAFGVSRNTARRYVRQGAIACGRPRADAFGPREGLELVRSIARSRRSADPDELESALTAHLAKIYVQRTRVADWQAFLITALTRRARSWLRDRRRHERRFTSVDLPESLASTAGSTMADIGAVWDVDIDDRLTLERLRDALSVSLRRVLDVLIIENFDQTRAAQHLGVHRNTIRNALRRIRSLLKGLEV